MSEEKEFYDNDPKAVLMNAEQAIWVKYFSTHSKLETKNQIPENYLIFTQEFNLGTISEVELNQRLYRNPSKQSIVISDYLSLMSPISSSYFDICTKLSKSSKKDQTSVIPIISIDLIRAFICFSYQFNKETLISHERNVMQLLFMHLPALIKCANDFQADVFSDFMFLFELFMNKYIASIAEIISSNSSFTDVCCSLNSVMLQLETKSIKNGQKFPFLIDDSVKIFIVLLKLENFSKELINSTAEFLIFLKSEKCHMSKRSDECFVDFVNLLKELIKRGKNETSNEWFSVLNIVLESFKLVFPFPPDKISSEEFSMDHFVALSIDLVESFYLKENENAKNESFEAKEPIDIEIMSPDIVESDTFGKYEPFNFQEASLKLENKSLILIHTLFSLFSTDSLMLQGFLDHAIKNIKQRDTSFLRSLLARYFLANQKNDLLSIASNWSAFLDYSVLNDSCISTSHDSLYYIAFSLTISLVDSIVKLKSTDVSKAFVDVFTGFIAKSDPIIYHIFLDILINAIANKKLISFFTLPVLYDGLFAADGRFKTIILQHEEKENVYLDARSSLLKFLGVMIKEPIANTIIFCNKRRTFFILNLVLENNSKTFAIESISKSLFSSKAPFVLISTMKEWILSNSERINNLKYVEIISFLLVSLSSAITLNTSNCINSIMQSGFDAALCSAIKFFKEEEAALRFFQIVIDFISIAANESYAYVNRLNSMRILEVFLDYGDILKLRIEQVASLFKLIIGKMIDIKGNLENEQILITPAIIIAYKLTLDTELHKIVISAFLSLSKTSIANRYQFFKSGLITELIDFINDSEIEKSMYERPLITQIATSFFHKRELSELFHKIVQPPMQSSSFFILLLNLMLDQHNAEKPDAFFHVSGNKKNFERSGFLSSFFEVSFLFRYTISDGSIFSIKSSTNNISINYIQGMVSVNGLAANCREITSQLQFQPQWNNIIIRFNSSQFEFIVNNEQVILSSCIPLQSGQDAKISIGGVVCDIENIAIKSGKHVSKYSASLTRDTTCIDYVGGVDAVFKGLIIPFSPRLLNTFVICGGPKLILPFFEAVPKSSCPSIFLLSIIDFLLQMISRVQTAFLNQMFFQCLNSLLRKISPYVFNSTIISKIITLYDMFTEKSLINDMKEYIFGDTSLLVQLHLLPKQYVSVNAPFSDFSLAICSLEDAYPAFFDGTDKMKQITYDVISMFMRSSFTYEDASILSQLLLSTDDSNFAFILMDIFEKKLIDYTETLLSPFSSFHFFFPFARFFANVELQRKTLKLMISLGNRLPRETTADFLSAMKSSVIIMKEVDECLFDDIFFDAYGDDFNYDMSIVTPNIAVMPLICHLIGSQKEETKLNALKFIRNSLREFNTPFTGWETYLLYLAQMDEDPSLWMPIICRIVSKQMKHVSSLFLLLDIVIAITGIDKKSCITSLNNEMAKSMLYYHASDITHMPFLLRSELFSVNVECSETKVFTSFAEFVNAITNSKVSVAKKEGFSLVDPDVHYIVSLLKAVAYGGGILFAEEEIRVLFVALFISLIDLDKDSAVCVSDYLVQVASKTSRISNFQIPVFTIIKLLKDTTSFPSLQAFSGCFDAEPPSVVENYNKKYSEIIENQPTVLEQTKQSMVSIVNESIKTQEGIAEDNEVIIVASLPLLPYYQKIHKYMTRKHMQNDLILNKTLKTIKGSTSSLWKNAGGVHRKFSNIVDELGRHTKMAPIKTFNPHNNAVFDADVFEMRTVKPFLDIDQGMLAEKLVETNDSFKCSQVTVKGIHSGTVFVMKKSILFEGDSFLNLISQTRVTKPKIAELALASISHVLWRRYQLIDCAVEIFTNVEPTIFLVFQSTKERNAFIDSLFKNKLPNAKVIQRKPSVDLMQSLKLTNMWNERKITNYEYIYWLNMFAGRSFNDITQYPVFPWIIKDYTSEELDLENPETYRDLSKMIGELNEARLQTLKSSLDEFNIEFGLYRSFFTNLGIIVNLFVRCEPFTTLNIELQNGHFDNPNRIFQSMQTFWKSVTGEQSDFRELTPEFFTTPDILENANKYNLGVTENGNNVNDVKLPPWAKTSHEFITLNRFALESPHVSKHLNEWIDNIFGYRQGKLEYNNLFACFTYPEASETISSEKQNHAMNFGIMPEKLFSEPHPQRAMTPELEVPYSLTKSLQISMRKMDIKMPDIVGLAYENGVIYAVYSGGDLSLYNNQLTLQQTHHIPQFSGELSKLNKHCVILPSSSIIISSAPWRTTFDVYNYQQKHKFIAPSNEFRIPALHASGELIAIGSIDSSVKIMMFGLPVKLIVDHTQQIVDVAVSSALRLVVSVDTSSTMIISTPTNGPIAACELAAKPQKILITDLGYIIAISSRNKNCIIETFDEKGSRISNHTLEQEACCCTIMQTHDFGQFLVLCMATKQLYVIRVFDLAVITQIQTSCPVVAMAYSRKDQAIVFVQSNGDVMMLSI